MLKLQKSTISLLEDIERRIDPETEKDFAAQWHTFLYEGSSEAIFRPRRKRLTPPGTELQPIPVNQTLNDLEAMLQSQLNGVSASLNHSSGCLAVRANYGTGILSSLFGAEIFQMPLKSNTLPTTRSFNDTEKIRALVEKGMPDLENGFGKQVLAFGEMYREIIRQYPKTAEWVSMYHPDLQGPLDICELLWGCDMFYAMYDEPELVHAMLGLITETYTSFLRKWFAMFPCGTEMNVHWSLMHRGRIMLRSDSAMNLSPALYEEFSVPYDKKLLAEFGGGAVHFCGRGDHYIGMLTNLPCLYGINMSQPHLNNMEVIYRNTVDKGIPLLGFSAARAEADKSREGGYHGRMHAV